MAQTPIITCCIFASHYQFVVCDDPGGTFSDDENWDDAKFQQGFAGAARFRMIGTEADGNEHWLEVVTADELPDFDHWDRVTCVPFTCATGCVHITSVVADKPFGSARLAPGVYSLYAACRNPGVDQFSLGEDGRLSAEALALRKDLEWYRVYIVPGEPDTVGRLKGI